MRHLILASLTFFLTAGCTQQDRDCLSRVGKKLFAQIEDAAGTSPDPVASGIQAVRGAISPGNLDSRVVLRLRWERELDGTTIRVRVMAPGTIQLDGLLKAESQRMRAIEVAKATTGVDIVEDKLKVAEDENGPQ